MKNRFKKNPENVVMMVKLERKEKHRIELENSMNDEVKLETPVPGRYIFFNIYIFRASEFKRLKT
jgi:hypothetical protein